MTISRYATYPSQTTASRTRAPRLPALLRHVSKSLGRLSLDNDSGEDYVPNRLIDMSSFRPLRPLGDGSCGGPLVRPSRADGSPQSRPPRRPSADPQDLSRLRGGRHWSPDRFAEGLRAGDELRVGLRILAWRDVDDVLKAGADVAAERQRRGHHGEVVTTD